MEKNVFKKIIAIASGSVLALSSLSMVACGGNSSNQLQFWVYGGNEETALYDAMTNKFNETYGKEHGIEAKISIKPPAGYTNAVEVSTTSANSCPDVFLVVDDTFRTWIGKNVITNMDSYLNAVTDIDVSDIYSTSVDRLRYEEGTKKMTSTGDLYGLPISSRPLALYYNETMYKNAGIVIISVDEADMEEFNKGNFKDRNGKTLNDYKAEYPQLSNLEGDIPSKGFFRSMFPYTGDEAWKFPDKDEVLIFNNRIAMNWDELEDISMLFTPSYNSKTNTYFVNKQGNPTLKRGFFTEWWFSYCWSVGGDCLQDLTGQGDWDYSLLDPNPNYMVMEDGFVGSYTGTTYSAGETVSFMDRFDVPQGATIVSDGEGGYKYNGTAVEIADNIQTNVSNGTLYELPSTREAFNRYLRLGTAKDVTIEGQGGIDVAPKPLELLSKKAENFFFSCNIAMLIDYSSYLSVMSEQAESMGFSYDVAPLPIYKEYVSSNPYEDETKVVGKPAGQSSTYSMVSCPKSTKKENAAIFMKWMASEAGQSVAASRGFFPNQESLVKDIKFEGYAPKNVSIFAEGLKYQTAGDWMYMPDYGWINVWAVPLNSYVRNGTAPAGKDASTWGYEQWKKEVVPQANNYLKENYK